MNDPSADEVIARLELEPHPEGGHYRETFRDTPPDGGRGAVTVIYYLLCAGERSAWHRIDAVEIWHFYAGAPLELVVANADKRTVLILGTDFAAGMAAHGVVPPLAWQSARSLGAWTLVGCTVAPAFDFKGFELAPAGWTPPWAMIDNRKSACRT
ncbi:MAG: cupin domain-containing protein [Rhodospirillales bacterium]|nr:cupin domain-containing protein [Rhodospirillales bacterium]